MAVRDTLQLVHQEWDTGGESCFRGNWKWKWFQICPIFHFRRVAVNSKPLLTFSGTAIIKLLPLPTAFA